MASPLRGTRARQGRAMTACAGLALALSGCAGHWAYTPPAAPVPAGFTARSETSLDGRSKVSPLTPDQTSADRALAYAGTPEPAAEQPQQLVAGLPTSERWWTGFHNASLDQLVDEAMLRHPTVAAAEATLRQAQADLEANRASYLDPQVTGQLGASRQQSNSASSGFNFPAVGAYNLFNTSVNVSYHPDLFGGIRDALDGLGAQVDVQRYQLEAARLSLAGNIVAAALREGGLRSQRRATLAVMQAQQSLLDLAQARLQLGSASRSDVLNAESALRATTASLPAQDKALALARDQLAAYVGRPDGVQALPSFELESFQLPAELPLSVPGELARQRPDLRAADASLRAANAAVGVADTNLYPSLTLSGSYGAASNQLPELLRSQSVLWSLGTGLTAPLFDGGALRARKRSAEAAYQQIVAQYRNTLLVALQSVDDVLAALQHDALALDTQRAALASARAAEELSAAQLKLGSVSRQQVLVATVSRLQAEVPLGVQRATRLADTAALYQALGGGWSTPSSLPGSGTHP